MTQLGEFQTFCNTLYKDILDWFPNAHISPSTHKSLAHAWELIERNDGYGLGALSEEGLEGCNKLLRAIRISLSRKSSADANLYDCVNKLWRRSDPISNYLRWLLLPYCTTCQDRGHGTRYCPATTKSADDCDLFESFFQ